MVQTSQTTVNPAGNPKITERRDDKPYTRETYLRDLAKVSSKTAPHKSDEEKS